MKNDKTKEPEFSYSNFKETIDKEFTDIVHNLPNELTSYIQEKINAFDQHLFKHSFQLELVVDTNIIFQEVRSLMLNNSSFFLRIIDNPSISICAPSQLKIELYEKIKIKFPKDKKTKSLNIKECLAKADMILEKINIRDDFNVTSTAKAKSILEERDPKDISFVALNFSLKAHGMLTNDKDILDQEDVQTWKLKDAGKVITTINKGTYSFFILSHSVPILWKIIYDIITFIWTSIIRLISQVILIISNIIHHGINAVKKIPIEIYALFGMLYFIFEKEIKETMSSPIQAANNSIKNFINEFKLFIKKVLDALSSLARVLEPILDVTLAFVLYLTQQTNLAIQQLDQLETARHKN